MFTTKFLKTINLKNSSKLILSNSTFRYRQQQYCTSNSNKVVEDFYDPENPETQTFNWLTKRIDKKVSTYKKVETPTSSEQQPIKKQQQQQEEEEVSFENKFEHYLNLLNQDYLKEELKNASEEIKNNSPIDRANLSFTTLIRVCGKQNDEESRIKEIVKRLLSLNGINQNMLSSSSTLKNLKFKLSQAHTIMRDFLLRSNSIMVEQVFKFINSNKDRFINDLENGDHQSETWLILIESLSSNGDIKKCLKLIDDMNLNNIKYDKLKVNRLICIGYSNSNQPELALEHYTASSSGGGDLIILNSILNCFSRQNKIEKMESLFENYLRLNNDHYTIQYLVEGYIKVNQIDKAIEILKQHSSNNGGVITTQTFNSIFTKLGKLNRLDEMMLLFNNYLMGNGKLIIESLPIETDFDKLSALTDLVQSNFKPNINTINILIDACCQCNNIDMAYHLFNTLLPRFNLSPSSETYSILEAISFKLKRMDLYKNNCTDYFHIIKKED